MAVGHNSIGGNIPSTLFKNISTTLQELTFNENFLTGSIPADLCLQLPSLQYLSLRENNLTGAIPSSLGNCTNLIDLYLHINNLTGSIPSELGMIPNLTALFLSLNNLAGTIPPGIGNCTSLGSVELQLNILSGVLPMELGRLNDLKRLLVDGNYLTGSIPSNLGNCTSLMFLRLEFNELSGAIPAQFSRLYQLQSLTLYHNYLSGTPLQHLGFSNLTALVELHLGYNNLTGSISPAAFSGLKQLRALILGNNLFTGHIPWDSFTNCTTHLFGLRLSHNQLSGPGIPSNLAQLQELKYLILDSNFLVGEIPHSANFSNLHLLQLTLSFNHFTGSLPSTLAPALFTLELLDFSNNNFTGPVPPWLNGITEVTYIDFSSNGFTGSIPDLGQCAGLTSLNLSWNHLSGDVPAQLGNVVYLEVLNLSHNRLSGELPSFIGTKLWRLDVLDVSFNNLTGPIPTNGVCRHLNASSFQGNPGLCGPILKKECIVPPQQEEQEHHSRLQLSNWRGRAVLIGALILLVILMGMFMCIVTFRRHIGLLKSKRQMIPRNSLAKLKRYTTKELLEATQGYSDDNFLGQGGVSAVYRGVLADGKVVAVKRLKDIDDDAQEALLREMRILSKLRHRNLVQVLGCVLSLDLKALVLEYMENGSLEDHLNSSRSAPFHERTEVDRPSYWDMVSRVAIAIAQALTYLHYEYGESIIHGDVKPSNILFDLEFVPHLADFGLAKLIMKGAESVSLTSSYLKGSIGYMAPEYAYSARVTTKVDVYSYGIVLLQMVTGRSPMEVAGPSSITLHEWAKSKLATVAEERLDGANWEEVLHAALFQIPEGPSGGASSENLQLQAVKGLLRMAVTCSAHKPEDRPTMDEVLAYLTAKL